MDIEKLKKEIVQRLAPIEPEKVILFGSWAWGEPGPESDLDIYVVTKEEYLPQNWQQKSSLHLEVARLLGDILQRYPTDLIVHTKSMHKRFLERNGAFARKVVEEGVVL